MGYPIARVLDVSGVDDELFCTVCLEPYYDARTTCSSGHCVCLGCLQMRHGAMCPICPKALLRPRPEELARNVNLQRACDQISAQCSANELCGWRGPLKDAAAHAQACPVELVECAFVEGGCTERLPIGEVDVHARECLYRPVLCPHRTCTEAVIAHELDLHLQVCPLDECPNASCTFAGQREAVTAHRRYCDPMAHKIEQLQREAVNASIACHARTLHIQQLETSVHVRQGRIERQDRRIVELEGVAEAQRMLVDQAEARGRQLDDAVAASAVSIRRLNDRIRALEAELEASRRPNELEQMEEIGGPKRKRSAIDDGRARRIFSARQPTPPQENEASLPFGAGVIFEPQALPRAWPAYNAGSSGNSLAHFLTSGSLGVHGL